MDKAARKAAPRLRRDFNEVDALQVSKKGPADFVSNADRAAEATIREILTHARPDWGLLMEEEGATTGNDPDHRWIVDPLDGTTNFLHGIPHFAISIAAEERGEVVAGLVYQPLDRREFLGRERQGRVAAGPPPARVGAPRDDRERHRHRHSVRRPRRRRAVQEDHGRGHARSRRHPPLRIGGARPRVGRGGALRRLLGGRAGNRGTSPPGSCWSARRAASSATSAAASASSNAPRSSPATTASTTS